MLSVKMAYYYVRMNSGVSAAASATSSLGFFFVFSQNSSSSSSSIKIHNLPLPIISCSSSTRRVDFNVPGSSFTRRRLSRMNKSSLQTHIHPRLSPYRNCKSSNTSSANTNYEFYDGHSDVELRIPIGGSGREFPHPSTTTSRRRHDDVFVDADADGTSLTVRLHHHRSSSTTTATTTLLETNRLFDKIKPAETIWFVDDDDEQLVITLKKQDPELKWPDIVESWESLTSASPQLLRGTSIYIVGDSTQINQAVARQLTTGLVGYTLLHTQELLEAIAKQTIDSWLLAEGADSVAEAESAILESLSSHVRAVVSTLGGRQGAARRSDKWRHLYAGFTVWLSETQAIDEDSAKEEARRLAQDGSVAYSNADVVVKVLGWDADHAKAVAQASLSALKQLIMSDKKLPGKKSLYIRLGCRGDWPNIKPPGWDPSTELNATNYTV